MPARLTTPARATAAGLAAAVLAGVAAAPASAVVGGRPAGPAFAAVIDVAGCTGTLVAGDRVLTAAHCVAAPERMRPVLGRTVTRVAVHPRYERSLRAEGFRHGDERADLAVLTLERPVDEVEPLALAGPSHASRTRPGRTLELAGLGLTRPNAETPPARPRRAALRVLADERCGERWRRRGGQYARAWEATTMLCLSDADGRPPHRSLCSGDSGGPVVLRADGARRVAGVASWGRRCGADGDPSVATAVDGTDPFLAWALIAPAPRA